MTRDSHRRFCAHVAWLANGAVALVVAVLASTGAREHQASHAGWLASAVVVAIGLLVEAPLIGTVWPHLMPAIRP